MVFELRDRTQAKRSLQREGPSLVRVGLQRKAHPTWGWGACIPASFREFRAKPEFTIRPRGFPPPGFLLLWLGILCPLVCYLLFSCKSKPRSSPRSILLRKTVVIVDMPGTGDRITMIRPEWPLLSATGAGRT